jgi:methyltransferase-like protein 6
MNPKSNVEVMNRNVVQYFDSDFSFEDHARDCIALLQQRQQQQLDKPSSSCTCSVTASCHPSSTSSFVMVHSSDIITEDHTSSDVFHEENDHQDNDDDDNLHPQSQAKFWDAFHTHHSAGNFYKPRRYLTKSFPCIMQYCLNERILCPSGDDHSSMSNQGADPQCAGSADKIILEIGCGSGSSCVPIIKQYYEIMLVKQQQYQCPTNDEMVAMEEQRRILFLACDSSSVAVETTRRSINSTLRQNDDIDHTAQPIFLFGVFVADPSQNNDGEDNDRRCSYNNCSLLRKVKMECEKMLSSTRGSLDEDDVQQSMIDAAVGDGTMMYDGDGIVGIVLLVFVLSAVPPSIVDRFVQNVFLTTKPGGKVCFRDYGLYDMPMLRFDQTAVCKSAASDTNDPVFVRGEGTIAGFFSIESVREIFESVGFAILELRYCTVFNHNRKTGQKLKRVFIHGVFEKPAS